MKETTIHTVYHLSTFSIILFLLIMQNGPLTFPLLILAVIVYSMGLLFMGWVDNGKTD